MNYVTVGPVHTRDNDPGVPALARNTPQGKQEEEEGFIYMSI